MKLKQIEEIATYKVPVWQPIVLILLLLLGYFIVPILAKNNELANKKKESPGMTLGVETFKDNVADKMLDSSKPYIEQAKKDVGTVLGVAQVVVQNAVSDIASRSADTAKEFVFDSTFGKVLQNINSLPSDQQDLIRKAICK